VPDTRAHQEWWLLWGLVVLNIVLLVMCIGLWSAFLSQSTQPDVLDAPAEEATPTETPTSTETSPPTDTPTPTPMPSPTFTWTPAPPPSPTRRPILEPTKRPYVFPTPIYIPPTPRAQPTPTRAR